MKRLGFVENKRGRKRKAWRDWDKNEGNCKNCEGGKGRLAEDERMEGIVIFTAESGIC